MILNNDSTLLICGGAAGSGKSYLLLLMILKYVDCPNWRGVIFRRSYTEIESGGGLLDEASAMYFGLPKKYRPTLNRSRVCFTFPSGAQLQLASMQHHPKDTLKQSGSQFSFIGFDELFTFEEQQFVFLFSRLRSRSKYPGRVVCTTNPYGDTFILKYVIDNLDEGGFPIKSLDGKKRYFIRRGEDVTFADTEEELKEKFGDKVMPISFSFISANCYDNTYLMENQPEYVAHLESLKDVDRDRLLHGCWFAKEKAAKYFDRDWLNKLDEVPRGSTCCRGWDRASSPPSEKELHPDFTACCKVWRTRNGDFIITGQHSKNNYDDVTNTYGRFRKTPGERENIILEQAISDGESCTIVLSEDPGSAGKFEYKESAKVLMSEGFLVKRDPACPTASKLKRFEPFSIACQNGLVSIVESTFDRKTLDAYYKELEDFDGERSSRTRKDDQADATATAFNYISQKKNIPIVCRNQQNLKTMSNSLLNTL